MHFEEASLLKAMLSFFKITCASAGLGLVLNGCLFKILESLEIDHNKEGKTVCWLYVSVIVWCFIVLLKSFAH